MAKAELRKSIFRVLSDLIKSDNVITIDEIDGLDETCKKFGITGTSVVPYPLKDCAHYRCALLDRWP